MHFARQQGMPDHFQNGVVVTLPQLKERPREELEIGLRFFLRERRVLLLLQTDYAAIEGAALPRLGAALHQVDYVDTIVLSLDGANADQFRWVKESLRDLPVKTRVIWNEGPRMQEMRKALTRGRIKLPTAGRDVGLWLALGYGLHADEVDLVVSHGYATADDQRAILARLLLPVASPGLDFCFAKGYHAQVGEQLHGRLSRLFYAPLIRALGAVLGPSPFSTYLGSFRHALSSELACSAPLARSAPLAPCGGLALSLLRETFEQVEAQRICQVEVPEQRDQALSPDAPRQQLFATAVGLATTLFGYLREDGVALTDAFFRALVTSYRSAAERAVTTYKAVALFNDLHYDPERETTAVEALVEALELAADTLRAAPLDMPQLVAWASMEETVPHLADRLVEEVELDNCNAEVGYRVLLF